MSPTSIDAESLQEHVVSLGSAGEAHRRRAFAGECVPCSLGRWRAGPALSDTTVPSSLLFQYRFLAILDKSYLQFLRSLVFNKNITCTMFSRKNNCYDLILLFKYKFISVDIPLLLLWNFYAMLWVVWECYDKYFMIFGVLYLWYEIHVDPMACFLI